MRNHSLDTIYRRTITPGMAADILANNNRCNRSAGPKTVSSYARDMSSGNWRFAGDPLRFDKNGYLLDGQHRLMAVVASGMTIEFVIVEGLDQESQQVMDSGRMRSVADDLRIKGMQDSRTGAAVARSILHWMAGDSLGLNLKLSKSEVTNFVEANVDLIEDASARASKLHAATKALKAVSGAVYFMAHKIEGEDYAELEMCAADFMDSLTTGAGLLQGSPLLLLRNKVIASAAQGTRRAPRIHEHYWFVRCWNAWRDGQELRGLQVPRGEMTMQHLRMV